MRRWGSSVSRGSGKTTFARALLGIVEPSAGDIELDGRSMPPKLSDRSATDVAALQIVFQTQTPLSTGATPSAAC